MNIEKFIPDHNNNWYVDHNTLFYKKGGAIAVLREIDNIIFISLDRRVTRHIIKLTKKLEDIGQKFFYCDRLTINEKHIYNEDIHRILKNYLMCISDEVFFKFIKNSEFDYIKNLTDFIQTFNCSQIFKECYDHLKNNYFNKRWMDWYTRKENWQIKNEEIRDYYSILERQVKLNIFFS